ncbi:hypothetical protein SDC9_74881 [bioreactor metagenome]|uniref:Uncharacterized protein n=1 Tax=bioreactor metagenome TaxID=1076179 RepID=A0A644YJ40_9ZZZZ
MSIKKQILGVPHRGQRTAKIGRQGLQNNYLRHVMLQPLANNERQRNKSKQCYIIGYKHRAAESNSCQSQRYIAQ